MVTRQSTRYAEAKGSELEARLFRRQDTPGHDACRLIIHDAERRFVLEYPGLWTVESG
ncbi:MAG: hypothetical protein ABI895_05320 [Deltaproteobacteria bacterium]